ncbi:hypothetical protein, partial [Anoxybacillus sp. LAT_11]|uniref:hypothetical protein n=1 Tax=Anoxybacillus sp. LAT_11 TaxID=2862718 RepID=UPI001EEAE1DF
ASRRRRVLCPRQEKPFAKLPTLSEKVPHNPDEAPSSKIRRSFALHIEWKEMAFFHAETSLIEMCRNSRFSME